MTVIASAMMKPAVHPARPFFSSGPCAKRPGWSPEVLKDALVGRSHRSKPGKQKLKDAIDRTKRLLGMPADYRLGIVPASDTGAVEMALWSLLGARPVDLFAWESFSEDWVTDAVKQLRIPGTRLFKAAKARRTKPPVRQQKNQSSMKRMPSRTSSVDRPFHFV